VPKPLDSRFAEPPKKVLFLHGMSSTGSRKTWFLRSLGFGVRTPRLSDWSLRSAVRAARAACDEFGPDVIVGSSRGGAVALAMARPDVPVVLLAPAWRFCGVPPRVSAPQAVVIHSPSDRWVRFDDSRELRRRNPHVRLIAAGDGHRLNDPAARAALADVLNDLFPTEEKNADC
jgi:predicted alpha/beta hydrolase family esterase